MSGTVLVVAKAPIPGFAKTRLSPPLSACAAANLAAAALLDTLQAVAHSSATRRVVALRGDLGAAERGGELCSALRDFDVIAQQGESFAERLVNAHRAAGGPVVQIGMDTPQVTAALLDHALLELTQPGVDAVLGCAADGGWWALGVRDPASAAVLTDVPMSTAHTGSHTLAALRARGDTVRMLPILSDVDGIADVAAVAQLPSCGAHFKVAAADLVSS